MSATGQPWTDADLATLRAMAPTAKWAEIGSVLRRTMRAVQKKANDLGIRRGPDHSDWTAESIARLRSDYPDQHPAAVALSIGRSEGAVRAKAYELGLVKSPAYQAALVQARVKRAADMRTTAAFHQRRAGRFEREGGNYTSAQDAARHLQRIAPVWRCNADGSANPRGEYWKFSGRVMDAAAIEARAMRAGWKRP